MRIGTPFLICTRVRIIIDEQNKRHLIFRRHYDNNIRQEGKKVPFLASAPGAPPERYYFCNNYFIPMSLFSRYLEATKDLSDEEVFFVTDNTLDAEGRMFAYQTQSWVGKKSPYSADLTNNLLSQCIKKMHLRGCTEDEIAYLFGVTVRRVRVAVDGNTAVPKKKVLHEVGLQSAVGPKGSRSILVPDELKKVPEYRAIKKAANYARICAAKMGIQSTFLIGDTVPTLYETQGNSGNRNGDLVVPKVCPVLRTKLSYNESEAGDAVRVWRKTPGPDGMAPLEAGNVIVMSAMAKWAIEGVYGQRKLSHLDATASAALAEWQAKYGTRTVPRPTKIGRPRKP